MFAGPSEAPCPNLCLHRPYRHCFGDAGARVCEILFLSYDIQPGSAGPSSRVSPIRAQQPAGTSPTLAPIGRQAPSTRTTLKCTQNGFVSLTVRAKEGEQRQGAVLQGILQEGCINQHDGPSDRTTDHRPMLFVHSRMVRRLVRRC